MKKIGLTLLKQVSVLSFAVAVLSVNTTSVWFVHQPKEPKELSRLKKIK